MDLEVIRRILIEAKTTGVDKATADLKGLSTGYEGVTVASQKTETATESVTRKFQAMESRLDPASRAARQLAKDISTLDQSLAQGGVSAQRHGELLALSTANAMRMSQGVTQAAESHGLLGKAMETGTEKAREFAGEFGVLGTAIGSLNTPALAVVGTLGIAYLAFNKITESANEFAASMLKISNASLNIGITTTQFQALSEKASEFGISSERVGTSLTRLISNQEEFRNRTGNLYEAVKILDGGLAQQMVRANNAREFIDLLGQAYNRAGANAAALSKAAGLGRTNFDVGQLIKDLGATGGIEAAAHHAGDVIQKELIDKVKTLKTESDDMAERASRNFASIYAPAVLEAQKKWNEQWLEFSRFARDFAMSPDLAKLIGASAAGLLHTLGAAAAVPLTPAFGAAVDVGTAARQSAGASLETMRSAATNAMAALDFSKPNESANKFNDTLQTTAEDWTRIGEFALAAGEKMVEALERAETQAGQIQAGEKIAREFNKAGETIADLRAKIQDMQVALIAGGNATLLEPAINAARVQLNIAEDAKATTERHNAVVLQLAQSYGNVSDSTALVLQNQKDQLAVAGQVTGAARIQAQEVAKINQLLIDGKSLEDARRIAAGQTAIARASINASVADQIHGLQQQTELIRASVDGTTDLVKQQQAYDDALRSGKTDEQAQQIAAAVREQQLAQQDVKAQKQQIADLDAVDLAMCQRINAAEDKRIADLKALIKYQEEVYDGQHQLLDQMNFNVPAPGSPGSSTTKRIETGIPLTPGSISFWGGGPSHGIEGGDLGPLQTQAQADKEHQDRMQKAVADIEMNRVQAQISGDKGAEISAVQRELAYYQSQPRTLENLQQIKSLTDTLKQLMAATTDQTAATKDSTQALSGLYSRQFGQGFYDGGAAVGELIYGLDNNTAGAIDAMQKAANDNTKNQNDLLTNLSQNQIASFSYMGGGIVSATNGVQGELRTGFSNVVMAVNTRAGAPSSPGGTSPSAPGGISPPIVPIYPHIPGTPGFARGGSFTTAGYGGDDSNVVAFRVSPQRERVTITPVSGSGNPGGGASVVHNYNDIAINVPENTDEFRSTAMQVAEEIFNQVAVAGRRK